jgi:hypothetical protein
VGVSTVHSTVESQGIAAANFAKGCELLYSAWQGLFTSVLQYNVYRKEGTEVPSLRSKYNSMNKTGSRQKPFLTGVNAKSWVRSCSAPTVFSVKVVYNYGFRPNQVHPTWLPPPPPHILVCCIGYTNDRNRGGGGGYKEMSSYLGWPIVPAFMSDILERKIIKLFLFFTRQNNIVLQYYKLELCTG